MTIDVIIAIIILVIAVAAIFLVRKIVKAIRESIAKKRRREREKDLRQNYNRKTETRYAKYSDYNGNRTDPFGYPEEKPRASEIFGNEFEDVRKNKAQENNEAKYCPGCGAPIEPGAKFCTQCGTKLQ